MSNTPIFDQLVAEGIIPKQGKPALMRDSRPKKLRRGRRTKKQMEEARAFGQ